MTIASDARQHAQAHAIMLKLMTLVWRLEFGESGKAGREKGEGRRLQKKANPVRWAGQETIHI